LASDIPAGDRKHNNLFYRCKLIGFRMALAGLKNTSFRITKNKETRQKWQIGRGRFVFLGKAGKLQEQGAKNGRTEKVLYRNVKEYQRVVYSNCREDDAELAAQLVKANCATDRRPMDLGILYGDSELGMVRNRRN